MRRRRTHVALWLAAAGAALVWAVWSYRNGGLVQVLLASGTGDSAQPLDRLRDYLLAWGPLAPAVYVGAVVIEVVVAPIPGTLLYAPAGAIFGGLLGGTLSLIGNVIGAMVARAIAASLGEHALAKRLNNPGLRRYRDLVLARGVWVVFLLRVNPLTSSDLVSYAAGLVGVPMWQVALGTLLGMAPLCYAQSYLAEQLFHLLPGAVYVVTGLCLAYAAIVVVVLRKGTKAP